MFAVVSLVEIVAGVAGVAFEARKGGPFVFKDSLEDSLCAFVVLGLAAAYARRRERLVASAAVSGLAVGYALAKSVVVALTEGRPDTVSIGLTVACCGGGVGAFLVAAKEDRARHLDVCEVCKAHRAKRGQRRKVCNDYWSCLRW